MSRTRPATCAPATSKCSPPRREPDALHVSSHRGPPEIEDLVGSSAVPRIALIGTLDTKGAEIEYVRNRIRALGGEPIVIDSGILGPASGAAADVTREQVAAAARHRLEENRGAGSRGPPVQMMRDGVRAVCVRLHSEGGLQGALCLGGAEGALLGAYAMQALPLGVPKVIVSPSASGRRPFGPFVGSSDVLVMHSVVDILGLNPIAVSVFDNAAAAVVGMAVHAGRPPAGLAARTLGVTLPAPTTPGVMHLRDALERGGWQTVIFHANGAGGPAMEALARQGAIAGVVDYTLSELANSLMDGIHATGPERLTVVGEVGLPQVVVPGCVEFLNQGTPDTLPGEYQRTPR